MNMYIKNIAFTLSFILISVFSKAEGYKIKVRVKGIKDTICHLANYYGSKQYYKDTAKVDSKGFFTFEGKKDLPGGVYSVVMPNRTYFEFLVNEQQFSLETDTSNYVANMKVTGSKENTLFFDYIKFIGDQNKLAGTLNKEYKDSTTTSKRKTEIEAILTKLDTDVKKYESDLIANNTGMFVSTLLKAKREVDIPEAPAGSSDSLTQIFKYNYFINHYFDNINFSDERLLRTPVYHNKLEYYITKLTPQVPDSINKAADILVEKARANKEIFKYSTHWITNNYEKSNLMGMDAVFVHMAENYYNSGQAFWMDSTGLAKIKERSTKLAPLLINKTAPNIVLQDTSGTWQVLNRIKSPYTILFFWDPNCGHCKKSIPPMQKVYTDFKDKGVEVFAICTEFENKDWKKFVKDKNLSWINVSDSPEHPSGFRTTYDIYSTPVIYVLDKDKKILAKRIGAEQLDGFLKHLLKIKDPSGKNGILEIIDVD